MFKFLSCLVSPGFIGIVILEFEMKCKIKLISLRALMKSRQQSNVCYTGIQFLNRSIKRLIFINHGSPYSKLVRAPLVAVMVGGQSYKALAMEFR